MSLPKEKRQWSWKAVYVSEDGALVRMLGNWPDPERSMSVRDVADAVRESLIADVGTKRIHVSDVKHSDGWAVKETVKP